MESDGVATLVMNETDAESKEKILALTERSSLESDIKRHYDIASPYYQELWGQHIHHGLWRSGKESLTKEEASDELVDELLSHANLKKSCKILDVGCGVGGTSIRLSTSPTLAAHMVGITISEQQVKIANENVAAAESKGFYKISGAPLPKFYLMNGEAIDFPGEEETFDAIWICEALSHFSNKPAFFSHTFRMLKPGGKLVLADWFRAENISKEEDKETIKLIEYGMLLPKLETKTTYLKMMSEAGLEVVYLDDVSKDVSPTWDISASLIFFSFFVETCNSTRRRFLEFFEEL